MLRLINIVLYLMVLNTSLYAQLGGTTLDIPISVSVAKPLILNKVSGNLDFGDVLSTGIIQTFSKLPQDGVLFEVSGIVREGIIVNYSTSVLMDNSNFVGINGGVLGNMTFIPIAEHTFANSTYVNPRRLKDGRRIRLRNSGGIGKLFIWLGGDIEIQSNQPIGQYKGTFNITVAY